jgi:hypothetical protein
MSRDSNDVIFLLYREPSVVLGLPIEENAQLWCPPTLTGGTGLVIDRFGKNG